MRQRVVIIGGGVLGLAHAYLAARRGHAVTLLERGPAATGASIRNFGMIWPIGQPAGEMHDIALRSREIWLEVLDAARLPYRPTGSLHLAYRGDEAEVLREFADIAPRAGYSCQWLTPRAVCDRSAAVRPGGLEGGLWSETEFTVDPRQVISRLPEYLEELGVTIRFGSAAVRVDPGAVFTASAKYEAEAVIVCSGDDFQTLFPDFFRASGLTRCKLQMMRTAPQPLSWQLGPSLAAGLTLRFYKAFEMCSTLPKLRERIAREMPGYDRYFIHVLVSQSHDGAITLGDSHEYGECVDIFDKSEIDDLILREAKTFLQIPDFNITQHWHGVYATHPKKSYFTAEPAPGVRIVTGVGGSGMTLSFGLAERTLAQMNL